MSMLQLPPGERFVLPTTLRVFEQGASSPSCCAHAVATAMETRMVKANGLDPHETPIDAMALFAAGGSQMSLTISCGVASKGVATPHGLEKATTERILGDVDVMAFELKRDVPLMIAVNIGSNFSAYDGSTIYRATGPRSLHALCVIGFGTDASTMEPYWIVKNSHGPTWGDKGCGSLRWQDGDVKPESSVFAMRSVTP
jgi:hypothetical protein